MILLAHFDLTKADLAKFDAYEDAVLPLLADHGGVLQRRFRSPDNALEVHILYYPSTDARQAYLTDQRRAAQAPLFQASGASATLIEVDELKTSS